MGFEVRPHCLSRRDINNGLSETPCVILVLLQRMFEPCVADVSVEREACRSKRYEEAYRRSLQEPEEFWAEVGRCVSWTRPWDKVLDNSREPFTKWCVKLKMEKSKITIYQGTLQISISMITLTPRRQKRVYNIIFDCIFIFNSQEISQSSSCL